MATRNARLPEGRARLQRLRDQPRPFFEKAKLVQASVWAQCLYGLEGHVLSAHDFRSLRTLASVALVGPYASASPYLTLAAVTTRVQDPQLYCLEAQLRALRRMWAFDPGAAASIQFWASRPDVPRRAYGPGTALCISLARAGLTLSSDGLLKSPSCHAVNIAECSTTDLRQVLGMAWAHHVADRVAHRNGLHAGHLPCPLLTQRALTKLAPHQVQIVVRHIVGGFLSSAAKHKWDDNNPVDCPLCGCPDTKWHRVATCSALAHVRERWWPLVGHMLDDYPHWVHCPYAVYPDDCQVPALIFASRKLPELQEDVPPALACAPSHRLQLFTDGSCSHSCVPVARHAGFSVVQDTFASQSQAAASLALWRSTGQLPCNFHVACMGLVPGSQSSNRAELCAVVQACRHANRLGAPVTDIYTHSSFALAEWERLARSQPCHYPDLAWALVSSWRRQYSLHKVKAHLSPEGLDDDALWKTAGNHVADVAAKQAVQDDFPCLHDFTSGIASEWRKQGDSLYLFLRYLLEVFCEEARLKEQLDHMAQPAEHLGEAGDLQGSGCSVAEWQQLTGTPEPWRIPPCDRDWLLASAWPPWFTQAVWSWCQQLEWDTGRPTHRGVLGAAHIELLANFVVVTGFLPPSSLQDRRPGGPHQLPEEVRTVRMLTLSLSGGVRQLEGLTGVSLWPPRCRRTTALRVLGRDETYGVSVRPKFPLPAQTLQVVKQLCQTSSVRVLEEWARRSSPSYTFGEIDSLYSSFDPSRRASLARWLKRVHKRGS